MLCIIKDISKINLRASPPQLHSNTKFIQLYRRQTMLVSEATYYFTNLVSAKTFILDLNAKSLSMEETEFEKTSATSNDRKSFEEQRGIGPSHRIYGNNTITSGELQTPKIVGTDTTGDVEKLLSVCKDVVRKYTNLCRAARHVSMAKTVAPIPHFEGNNISFKQPAIRTSASTDSKREE
ncbi:hypothetical protein KPL71_008694 [Citrus sinensis]|uniref:Uncharacterized protein n=1 Tax=Citrus sinensis TaxID=2711 RepID=A0ACB8M7X7_CITSI|nr:hypothetical protein KPL71_008694 [Citrus sinensis]